MVDQSYTCYMWSVAIRGGVYVLLLFRQSYEVGATQDSAASLFHFFQQAATDERSEVREILFLQNDTPNYDAYLQVFAVC